MSLIFRDVIFPSFSGNSVFENRCVIFVNCVNLVRNAWLIWGLLANISVAFNSRESRPFLRRGGGGVTAHPKFNMVFFL